MAWERLRRAKEWVEDKIDREGSRNRSWREERHRDVRSGAQREYIDTVTRTRGKLQRGEISRELYTKRVQRAEARREKVKEPIENRAGRALLRAGTTAADVMYNPGGKGFYKNGTPYTPGYAQRIRAGRKRAYEGMRYTTTSYNKYVPSAFGLGTGKGKGKKVEKAQWSMVYGAKKSSGRKGRGGGVGDPGWRILYG